MSRRLNLQAGSSSRGGQTAPAHPHPALNAHGRSGSTSSPQARLRPYRNENLSRPEHCVAIRAPIAHLYKCAIEPDREGRVGCLASRPCRASLAGKCRTSSHRQLMAVNAGVLSGGHVLWVQELWRKGTKKSKAWKNGTEIFQALESAGAGGARVRWRTADRTRRTSGKRGSARVRLLCP